MASGLAITASPWLNDVVRRRISGCASGIFLSTGRVYARPMHNIRRPKSGFCGGGLEVEEIEILRPLDQAAVYIESEDGRIHPGSLDDQIAHVEPPRGIFDPLAPDRSHQFQ